MKFRTKLCSSFIVLVVMGTSLALFVIYGEASRLVFKEIRRKILSVVSNATVFISSADLENYIQSGDRTSSEYEKLKNEVTKIKEMNLRTDIFLNYVYIIRSDPSSDHYKFVIGDQKGKSTYDAFNQEMIFPMDIPNPLDHPYVTTTLYSKEVGTWIAGYAPIFNAQGKQIALLGIEIQTKELYVELKRLLLYGLIAFGLSIIVALIFSYFLSKLVSSSLFSLCETVEKIGEGDLSCRSTLRTHDEFNQLSTAINKMAQGLEERERLKLGFTRYVSQYALEELLKTDQPITLKGERKKVTILFSDIRQFTTISERLPPEKVLNLLNEYFAGMIEVIFNYGGTLDKFIGDGLMVEFGAPLEDRLQELHAVLAAIHMQQHLNCLCDKWEKEGRTRLSMGIGIHTGLAVLGNIGSERRMEYTAIGDTVNIASRLEMTTKKLKKDIIVSETVYEKVKNHFTFEDLHEVEIRGREGYIRAYALDPNIQKDLSQIELAYEMPDLDSN